ncbi:MAG: universal stress protein [Hyphomicrobium sp.]|jgi:nucleotide-binding universal stress UspA family protein
MSYKTILLHATDNYRFRTALRPALALARRFDAHLVSLAVLPPPIIQEPLTATSGETLVVEGHRRIYAEDCVTMKAFFEQAAREAGLEDLHEWIMDDATASPVWQVVSEYARSADIAIASQSDVDGEGPEELVLAAGRPVLVVPARGDHAEVGRRVLVAWNGRREAARAAFDALPLLVGADVVRILWVNPGDEQDVAQDVPAADLATALARHNVRCEAAEITRGARDTGEVLLGEVREMGADLLVMGCYGHSRLREYILGGATRTLLRNMTVPILMSH